MNLSTKEMLCFETMACAIILSFTVTTTLAAKHKGHKVPILLFLFWWITSSTGQYLYVMY